MQSPDLRNSFEYAGKTYNVEWFDETNAEALPDVVWKQVYAICNLDGEVPVVLYQDEHINLPGGKPEPGETIEQTLHREIEEEINCRVVRWHPIGYQKIIEPGMLRPAHQLRVYAEVQKIGEFEQDPGGNVVGYKPVPFEDLNDIIEYGNVGARMMDVTRQHFRRSTH